MFRCVSASFSAFAGAMLAAPAFAENSLAEAPFDETGTDEAAPALARALIDEAAASGDPAEVAAVARAAARVFADDAEAVADYGARAIEGLEALQVADQDAAAVASQDVDAPAGEEAVEENVDAVTLAPSAVPARNGVFALAPWDGDARVSAVSAFGNSDNIAVGLAFSAKRIAGDYTQNLTGYFDIGESAGELNQKRWGASYKLDYSFSERGYGFARLSYDEDEFSGFDYRLFSGAGVGWFLNKSDNREWKIESGPGFRYSPIDDTNEVDRDVAVYAASEFEWTLREGVNFSQDARATWTTPTTTLESITSLTTELWAGITTGFSLNYRYETDPPEGRVNADTVVRANLGYKF